METAENVSPASSYLKRVLLCRDTNLRRLPLSPSRESSTFCLDWTGRSLYEGASFGYLPSDRDQKNFVTVFFKKRKLNFEATLDDKKRAVGDGD